MSIDGPIQRPDGMSDEDFVKLLDETLKEIEENLPEDWQKIKFTRYKDRLEAEDDSVYRVMRSTRKRDLHNPGCKEINDALDRVEILIKRKLRLLDRIINNIPVDVILKEPTKELARRSLGAMLRAGTSASAVRGGAAAMTMTMAPTIPFYAGLMEMAGIVTQSAALGVGLAFTGKLVLRLLGK